MTSYQILEIFLLFSLLGANAVDYCNYKKCGKRHIGCEFNGSFGSGCMEPRIIDIALHKETILRLHNDKRNEIAGGERSLHPATQMATMQWDDELANLAEMNVMTCLSELDKCHTTERFTYSGQNIGLYGYNDKESRFTDDQLVKQLIENWLAEQKHVSMQIITKYPTHPQRTKYVGHFTIIINQKTTHVGCAILRYKKIQEYMSEEDDKDKDDDDDEEDEEKEDGEDGEEEDDGKETFNMFQITCNYSYNNILGRMVYEAGDTASGCSTGTDETYPNLCSIRESYNLHV